MIRVLHVVGSMNRGGIETFIMNIYRNIDRSKIQFDFAVHTKEKCSYDEEIMELGGRIFYITPRMKNIVQHYNDWNRLFENHPEIQIVHQHVSSLTYINPLKFAYKNNVKTRIIHSHSTKPEGKIHYILHLLNSRVIDKYANVYFSCSKLASNWLYGKSKVNTSDIQIIQNGIDVDKFIFNKDKRDLIRKKLKINDHFVIGHVGRFSKVKNHKFLIDIFKEITNKIEKCKLILVGHGSEENEIRSYIEKMNLCQNVIILKNRTDVADILQAMDVFVFPSLFEGLGIALIEAQASGLMCFTSKEVVPSDVNITNLVHYLSLDEDKKYWANKIISLSRGYERENTRDLIIKSGYYIKDIAMDLQKMYISYLDKEGISYEI